jgi:hypothetical protein
MFKINSVVKSLLAIVFANLFLFVISYSAFLQYPVISGEPLVWQSVVEQSLTWIPFVIGYFLLFKAISRGKNKMGKIKIIEEDKLLFPSIFLIFLSGLSVGVHFSSQIIEDSLVNQQDLFVYKLAFFLDEQVGHFFIIPGIFLFFVLLVLEIQRERPRLSKVDNWLISLLAVLSGFVLGILAVEAGIIYLTAIPLACVAFYKYIFLLRQHGVNLFNYPFNRFFVITISITTLISIIWWALHGFLQPEEAGLRLFNLI